LIFFIFGLAANQLVAQIGTEFRLENITSEYTRIEKGLSQNSVNCVFQDSKGYVWIGTWSGLNRFDGYQFRTLNHDPYGPKSGLTSGNIVGITEDQNGFIWAATAKGLNRISPDDFSVKQYTTVSAGELGFSTDTLYTLYKDSLDLIWLGTSQGAFIFDPIQETFSHYNHNPRDSRSISDRQVLAFHEDSLQNMWIGTAFGLNYLIRETGQIIRYYSDTIPGYLNSSTITSLEVCDEGYVWIGTPNGLNRLDSETNWFEPYPLVSQESLTSYTSENHVTIILNDSEGKLWIGTQEFGLFIFDKLNKQFNNLQQATGQAPIFSLNMIGDILEDKTGLFWIGTSHRGLVKLIPEPHTFKSYYEGYPTYGIEEFPKDTFWFGTQSGVHVFSRPMNRTIKVLQHEYNNPNSLSNNRVTNIVNDGTHMWISTKNGLNKYHLVTEKLTTYLSDGSENTIAGNEIWGITKTSDGYFWFATLSGLSRYNPDSNDFINYRHDPANPNSLSNNQCYQVMEIEPGILLIATQYGLNRFNYSTNNWEVFLPIPGDLTSISAEYIFGIYEDSQGELWVYTNGGGINKFDPSSGTFEHFTSENGLADNIVYGMTEDRDGYFWIPTNNGLARFDYAEERFIRFDVQDGLPSNEFNFNGIYKTEQDEIFMATVNGISSFFPMSTLEASEPPPLEFTDFSVAEQGGILQLPVTDTVVLNFDQNSFRVGFAALDFLNPFKNTFSYRLDDYDDEWITLGLGEHEVEYRKLPPGQYKLRVIGANALGATNEKTLHLKIVPAWWQTNLFKILLGSTLTLLIGLIILLRYLGLQRKHQMDKRLLTIQNELVQSQKFALRSQMNPHFIFNSLNSIQNFVLKNDVDSANYYLSNFSILMRRVLEYSQYNLITLHEEVQLIELYIKMEKLRFSNKFKVKIEIHPEIDVHLQKIPPMLLQPYLENAILHGLQLIKHKGLLKLMIEPAGNSMNVIIEDNGIGRKKANEIRQKQVHKSKGLKNIEKRIQLYNRINTEPITVSITDLFSEADQPAGTRVVLNIPYNIDEPDA